MYFDVELRRVQLKGRTKNTKTAQFSWQTSIDLWLSEKIGQSIYNTSLNQISILNSILSSISVHESVEMHFEKSGHGKIYMEYVAAKNNLRICEKYQDRTETD